MDNKTLGIIAAGFAALLIIGGAFFYRARQQAFGAAHTYTLPPLPYAYDTLEPYIDAKTMEIHYTKHHQGYVDKLNRALRDYPEVRTKPIEYLLANLHEVPQAVRTAVRNNGGGHYNHSLFWLVMTPESSQEPVGTVKELIERQFGSFDAFKKEFNEAASTVFGSGWAWLVLDKQGTLKIMTTENQDTPLEQGLQPLLGLDVWEHAYYLKYQNKRADYSDAWWHVVNWDQVEKNYNRATGQKEPETTKE